MLFKASYLSITSSVLLP